MFRSSLHCRYSIYEVQHILLISTPYHRRFVLSSSSHYSFFSLSLFSLFLFGPSLPHISPPFPSPSTKRAPPFPCPLPSFPQPAPTPPLLSHRLPSLPLPLRYLSRRRLPRHSSLPDASPLFPSLPQRIYSDDDDAERICVVWRLGPAACSGGVERSRNAVWACGGAGMRRVAVPAAGSVAVA